MDKLIRKYSLTNQETLDDFILSIASTIEDSLLQAGAKPTVDYSFIDLYKLALPFALDKFNKDELLYTTSYPNTKTNNHDRTD